MRLNDYISAQKITISHAASQIGVSRQHLSAIVNRRKNYSFSKALAAKIERWTKGNVRAKDIMFPEH